MRDFEGYEALDGNGIGSSVGGQAIAFQVTEAINDMGEFADRETVDGGTTTSVVADDCRGLGMLLSEASMDYQEEGEDWNQRFSHI